MQSKNEKAITGKRMLLQSTIVLKGKRYNYKAYDNPAAKNFTTTVIIYRPGMDELIFDYDAGKDVFQKEAEKAMGKQLLH